MQNKLICYYCDLLGLRILIYLSCPCSTLAWTHVFISDASNTTTTTTVSTSTHDVVLLVRQNQSVVFNVERNASTSEEWWSKLLGPIVPWPKAWRPKNNFTIVISPDRAIWKEKILLLTMNQTWLCLERGLPRVDQWSRDNDNRVKDTTLTSWLFGFSLFLAWSIGSWFCNIR